MRLWLIRHGATATSGLTYAGRSDVALSDAGRAEAQRLAAALSSRPIALILTSPLSRAAETARPLAEALGLAPVAEPALAEFDFGLFEGRAKAELGLNLRKSHARTPVPGGESLWDVWARAGRVVRRIRQAGVPAGVEIAVVGHFWTNRLVLGRCTGLSFDEACRSRAYRPETGSVVRLDLVPDARAAS